MATPYDIHPSAELRELFAAPPIPFQGQDPQKASVIFVGLDANYAPELFDTGNFRERIIEYHKDGVAFWQCHGVHHPFLLPEYPLPGTQGGRPYHRKFSNMGLTPDFASEVSFVELLNIPTTGSTENKRFWELFDLEHAKNLDRLFNDDKRRLVLLSRSVVTKMSEIRKRYDVFRWLPKDVGWGEIARIGASEFHLVKHFSASISNEEISAIGDTVRAHCAC
jgi:hypothetical protein